jgi:propanol-preferring alcohol dehydrogenase
MRALQLVAPRHDPELREVADPEPGPGEVVVRIGGAGACHSDLHLLHERDQLAWSLPMTLGHENAGWVDTLGAGVRGLEVGQPVAVYGPWGCGRCARCVAGARQHCEGPRRAASAGLGADGGMAPRLLVPDPSALVPLGDLDPAEAAPLTDAGLTPYSAVKRSLPVLVPGSTAVVIGVGGLGHLAIQILRALCPARVVAVDTDVEALAHAQDVGADAGVPAGAGAAAAVRDLTGGRGADLVLDVVGADATLALAAAVVRPLGHVTIVGLAGGALPVSAATVPWGASVATTYWGSLPELREVLAMAEAGDLVPTIERVPLDRAVEAYARLRAGGVRGRLVVVP